MLKTTDGEKTTPKKFAQDYFEKAISVLLESDEDLFEALYFGLEQKDESGQGVYGYEQYELNVRNTLTQKELDEVAKQLAKVGTRLLRIVKGISDNHEIIPFDLSPEASRVEEVRAINRADLLIKWAEQS
jgi:hypothetical protein